jgi:hypothetical protein
VDDERVRHVACRGAARRFTASLIVGRIDHARDGSYARDVDLRALLLAIAVGSAAPARAFAFVPPNQGPKVVAARWTGTWTTDYGVMHLVQNGAVVTGDYSYGGPPMVLGRIDGRIDGLSLRLRWSESPNGAGMGDATFVLASDGARFTGTWTSDSVGTPGIWNGTRTP